MLLKPLVHSLPEHVWQISHVSVEELDLDSHACTFIDV